MASPPNNLTCDSRVHLAHEDWQRVKWAGWTLAAVVLLSWSGWVSLVAIENSHRTQVNQRSEQLHYEQLREDIAELKLIILNASKPTP